MEYLLSCGVGWEVVFVVLVRESQQLPYPGPLRKVLRCHLLPHQLLGDCLAGVRVHAAWCSSDCLFGLLDGGLHVELGVSAENHQTR